MDKFITEYNYEDYHTLIVDNITEYQKYIKTNKSNFTMYHNNIRSISKNFDEAAIFLEQFQNKFDVIIFSETWEIHDTNLFNIPDYASFYNNGNFNQNDGIIVYIKNKYDNYNVKIINFSEIKVIKIELKIKETTISVTAMYRSPATSTLSFNNDLKDYLRQNSNSTHNFIIGDINIDILSEKNEGNIQEYLNTLSEAGYKSLINKHTRVKNNSKTCIDHIFMKSNINTNSTSMVFRSNITDHYSIINSCTIQDTTENLKENKDILRINYKKVNTKLSEIDFKSKFEKMNTEEATNYFIKELKAAIQSSSHVVKLEKTQSKRKPWITAGLIQSVNTKQQLFLASKKNPNDTEAKSRYQKYRNKLTSIITITKNNYFKKAVNKDKSTKNMWNVVNSLTSNTIKTNTIKQIKNPNTGSLTSDNKQIADIFNNHYANIGQSMAAKIKNSSGNTSYETRYSNPNSIFLSPTDDNEIKKNIHELKPKKSPGKDGITGEMLKSCSKTVISPLTLLINKVIETGQYPTALKSAIIKPLFKSGDKNLPENYRPISLISVIAKIVEKVLNERLQNFIKKYKLISDKQYGFQEGKSTQDAIINLTQEIYQGLDEGKPSLCVFIDLAKAFDTVNHEQLLETLHNMGIRGKAYEIFRNYLANRPQYVRIGNRLSEVQMVGCGVPQGTVLGPVLFTIYVNELLELQTKGKIIAYADDTAIYYKSNNWNNLKQMVEEDIAQLKCWFDKKLLTVNYNKTKYIPFTCYKNNLPLFKTLNIKKAQHQDIEIEQQLSIKYLGIYIDCHLRWNIHIDKLVKKLRSLLFRIKTLKQFLDIHHLKTVYYALIESQIQYGIVAWGSTSETYMKPLEIIQKWILKIMYGKQRRYSTELIYRESDVLSTRLLYFKNAVNFQHKNTKTLKPIDHGHVTRTKTDKQYLITRANKYTGQRSLSFLGPRLYNKIPSNIRQITNPKKFTMKLKIWIQHNKETITAIL